MTCAPSKPHGKKEISTFIHTYNTGVGNALFFDRRQQKQTRLLETRWQGLAIQHKHLITQYRPIQRYTQEQCIPMSDCDITEKSNIEVITVTLDCLVSATLDFDVILWQKKNCDVIIVTKDRDGLGGHGDIRTGCHHDDVIIAIPDCRLITVIWDSNSILDCGLMQYVM